jgi:hypothetical protein
VPTRGQPIWQNRERPLARTTRAATHPDAVVPLVMSRAKSASVADDRGVLAQRADARQKVQWHYPGSPLSLVSASAIKRITAEVKARR